MAKYWKTNLNLVTLPRTHYVLIAKSSELNEFLTDEKFCFSDGRENAVASLVRNRRAIVRQILLEITDLFLELEHLVLDELKWKEKS